MIQLLHVVSSQVVPMGSDGRGGWQPHCLTTASFKAKETFDSQKCFSMAIPGSPCWAWPRLPGWGGGTDPSCQALP